MGMTTRSAVIGWPRWTPEASFSGGDWLTDYPALNAGSLPLSRVARSAGLAEAQTQVTMALPKLRPIQLLAIVRHNLSRTATLRVRVYGDLAGLDLLHDEILDVWPVVFPATQLPWESDSWWDGRYSEDEMTGYSWTRPIWLPTVLLARRIDLAFSDPSNRSGHLDIGLIEVAQGWNLSVNFDYDAAYGFDFRSTSTRALGGGEHFTALPKPRVFQGQVSGINRDEALARAFEHQRQTDLHTPFLWMPDPGEPLHWLRTVFLARNSNPGLLRYAYTGADSIPLSFIEVIES